MILNKLKMEFIGTFLLVYIQGFLYIQKELGQISLLGLAVGSFCVYSILIWGGASVSGSHYNPVLTMNLIFSKHIAGFKGLLYMFFQVFASIFAVCMLLMTISMDHLKAIEGATMIGFPIRDVHPVKQIIFEIICTFFLVFAYYMLFLEKTAPKYVYGAGIAGVVAFCTLFAHEYTGCGLNPARMVAYGLLSQQYLTIANFLVGNTIGAIIGAILGNLLLSEKAMISKLRRLRRKQKRAKKTMLNKRKK